MKMNLHYCSVAQKWLISGLPNPELFSQEMHGRWDGMAVSVVCGRTEGFAVKVV
jgi:hypothetical protein